MPALADSPPQRASIFPKSGQDARAPSRIQQFSRSNLQGDVRARARGKAAIGVGRRVIHRSRHDGDDAFRLLRDKHAIDAEGASDPRPAISEPTVFELQRRLMRSDKPPLFRRRHRP
jgi:hypothetical protein